MHLDMLLFHIVCCPVYYGTGMTPLFPEKGNPARAKILLCGIGDLRFRGKRLDFVAGIQGSASHLRRHIGERSGPAPTYILLRTRECTGRSHFYLGAQSTVRNVHSSECRLLHCTWIVSCANEQGPSNAHLMPMLRGVEGVSPSQFQSPSPRCPAISLQMCLLVCVCGGEGAVALELQWGSENGSPHWSRTAFSFAHR